MMRKLFLSLLGAMFFLPLFAQNEAEENSRKIYVKPDYDRIALEIADPTSPYYYPVLYDRYRKGDTTLTVNDFRYLYYGYPEQDNYRPLLYNTYADSLDRVFRRRIEPTPEDYRRVVYYAEKILQEQPFSMRDLNALAFAYQKLDEPELAARQFFKLRGVYDAIRTTGDGLSEKNPMFIVYLKDWEDVLNLMNARFTRSVVVSSTVLYVAVSNMPVKRNKGYYFDYGEVYKRKPDYLEDIKKQRKLEINPLYNPNSRLNTLPK